MTTIQKSLFAFFAGVLGLFTLFLMSPLAEAADKERVRCYFRGNETEQKCWDVNDPSNFCTGSRYCSFFVYGNTGQQFSVETSCGKTQNITFDGSDEKIMSLCGNTGTRSLDVVSPLLPVDPTPLICPMPGMPAPPEGCYYFESGNYTSENGCTFPNYELKCENILTPTPTPVIQAQDNCQVWYDGCNTCSRSEEGGMFMCTLRACFQSETPYCKAYFPEPTITVSPTPTIDPVVCTAEYDPVCGYFQPACTTDVYGIEHCPVYNETYIEGKTYGNYCSLKADGAELLYAGECSHTPPTPGPTNPPIHLDTIEDFIESQGKYQCWSNGDFNDMERSLQNIYTCGEYYQVSPPFGLADAPNSLYNRDGTYVTSCGGYMPYEMYQQQDSRCFMDCVSTDIHMCSGVYNPTPTPTITPSVNYDIQAYQPTVEMSYGENISEGFLDIPWTSYGDFTNKELPIRVRAYSENNQQVFEEIIYTSLRNDVVSGERTERLELWAEYKSSTLEVSRRISPNFTSNTSYAFEVEIDPFNEFSEDNEYNNTSTTLEIVGQIELLNNQYCTSEYQPVCGDFPTSYNSRELRTYSNTCEMNNAGATFFHNGECNSDSPMIGINQSLTFTENKRGVEVVGEISGGKNVSDNEKLFYEGQEIHFDTAVDSWNELEFYAILQILPEGWEVTSLLPQGCVQSMKENKVNVKCIDSDAIYSATPYYIDSWRDRIFTKTFAIPDQGEKAIVTRTNTYFTVK